MSLKAIIDDYNFWPKMQNKPLEMPENPDRLDADDADKLYKSLEGWLSPENLHCDGEITRSQAMVKYRKYQKAIKQLEALGFSSEGYYLD